MYLLFDIGGTKMRLATSLDGENIGEVLTIPTSLNFDEAMDSFAKTAVQLTNGSQISFAAGGVRALDMISKDRLVNNPNYPMWAGDPLKETLEKNLKAKVFLENDMAMVGLGEAVVGAGAGKRIVVYITVSTGIGGCRIVDGKIDKSAMGFEPGNQIIDSDASLLPKVDPPGYFERYISGAALLKRYGKKPEDINDPKIWEETARLLAIGLNNTIVHWSPDIVVLGGGLMNKISIDKVKSYLKKIMVIFPKHPEIVKAALSDVGGIHGALVYARQKALG